MKTRGPKRLHSITYGTLARWTGMKEGSIRNAVAQGRLKTKDLDGLLRWVNSRREAKGLPSVGDPSVGDPSQETTETAPLATPSTPDTGTTGAQMAASSDTAGVSGTPGEGLASHLTSCKCHECYLASKSKRAR